MATSRQNTYVRIPHPEGGTPNTGDLIELVFDKFSPRPHFIVRQTEGNVDKNTKANEIDETMLLVTKFLKNRPKYDQQALHDAYVNSVRTKYQKTLQKYNGYKQKLVTTATNLQSIPLNVNAYEKNGFSLVWMTPDPRIGVYSQKPQKLRLLYDFMVDVKEQIEKDLLSKDKSFRNFGCHFCLFVSAENQANTTPRACKVLNGTGTDVKTTVLVGYIQMDDQQNYRLLPDEYHRQTWFNDFKRHDFIVTT
ncbi:unnamed protein product [Adineta steineri]|uniref:Uncharacterized protein n=1 Tax=Adineta steineri TaxID=433720 RepID=A0A814X2L9_9BILA|nr:unnamed protein product [Adineta steineri]CAF1489789.1 unnamed protein product [Adineta steineri]